MATNDSRKLGLMAGLGMMAAAVGLAGGAEYIPPRREAEPAVPRGALNKRGKPRGQMPRASREMSESYRLAVIAQRGFSANRIQKLRAEWRKHNDGIRSTSSEFVEWHVWLDQHRTDRERLLAA